MTRKKKKDKIPNKSNLVICASWQSILSFLPSHLCSECWLSSVVLHCEGFSFVFSTLVEAACAYVFTYPVVLGLETLLGYFHLIVSLCGRTEWWKCTAQCMATFLQTGWVDCVKLNHMPGCNLNLNLHKIVKLRALRKLDFSFVFVFVRWKGQQLHTSGLSEHLLLKMMFPKQHTDF